MISDGYVHDHDVGEVGELVKRANLNVAIISC